MAVVFGVIAFGRAGILVLCGVALVLLCVELWRDAAQASSRRVEAQERLADAMSEAVALNELAAIGVDMRDRVEELEVETATLRAQLAAPSLTPQQTLFTLSNQLTLIDTVLRH